MDFMNFLQKTLFDPWERRKTIKLLENNGTKIANDFFFVMVHRFIKFKGNKQRECPKRKKAR